MERHRRVHNKDLVQHNGYAGHGPQAGESDTNLDVPQLQLPTYESLYPPPPTPEPPELTEELPITLPREFWPHNFLIFSITVAVFLGLFNILTIPITLSAMVLALLGQSRSKKGNYSMAKFFGKVTVALLLIAILFSVFCAYMAGLSLALLFPTSALLAGNS